MTALLCRSAQLAHHRTLPHPTVAPASPKTGRSSLHRGPPTITPLVLWHEQQQRKGRRATLVSRDPLRSLLLPDCPSNHVSARAPRACVLGRRLDGGGVRMGARSGWEGEGRRCADRQSSHGQPGQSARAWPEGPRRMVRSTAPVSSPTGTASACSAAQCRHHRLSPSAVGPWASSPNPAGAFAQLSQSLPPLGAKKLATSLATSGCLARQYEHQRRDWSRDAPKAGCSLPQSWHFRYDQARAPDGVENTVTIMGHSLVGSTVLRPSHITRHWPECAMAARRTWVGLCAAAAPAGPGLALNSIPAGDQVAIFTVALPIEALRARVVQGALCAPLRLSLFGLPVSAAA